MTEEVPQRPEREFVERSAETKAALGIAAFATVSHHLPRVVSWAKEKVGSDEGSGSKVVLPPGVDRPE